MAVDLEYQSPTQVDSDPWTIPLEDIDMSQGYLFKAQKHHDYFKRLRRDDPVHYHAPNPNTGPFWSITKFDDIMEVEKNTAVFSSEPSIALIDEILNEQQAPMFIAMDPPLHDEQRAVVAPAASAERVADLDDLIRERTIEVLSGLPQGKPFNWVDEVSIELTTRMLATLFDFPFEERRKLTFWSDMITTPPFLGGYSEEERMEHLIDCLQTFTGLFKERQYEGNDRQDFISLMANHPVTRDLEGVELLGNIMLLIVGGNDTSRNSMSAGIFLMDRNPAEFQKLKGNPALIDSAVAEIIRYHTPLSYMRRTATQDYQLRDKLIKKGDKLALWYASANRDEDVIPNPDEFIIDRDRVKFHSSFGFGIHRCMGAKVAEAQLRIVCEETLKSFDRLEVVGEPERVEHSFVHGYKDLQVIAHPKT